MATKKVEVDFDESNKSCHVYYAYIYFSNGECKLDIYAWGRYEEAMRHYAPFVNSETWTNNNGIWRNKLDTRPYTSEAFGHDAVSVEIRSLLLMARKVW